MRWLSVPPVTSVEAALDQRRRERLRVCDTICARTSLNAAAPPLSARPRCRRSCGCAGRPAGRGTPRGRSPSRARRVHMSMPPRGPRSVLCVVVETTSASGHRRRVRAAGDQAGDVRDVRAEARADLVRDRAVGREVDRARNRGAAAPQQLRALLACASSRTSSKSMRCVSLRTPYCTDVKYAPVIDTFQPWVRWPPAGSAHAHHGVAGLEEREVDGEVRGRARVRLHVRVRRRRTAPSRDRCTSCSTRSMYFWPS